MLHTSHTLRIAGTGSYCPSRIVTNDELALSAPTNAQWVVDNLGIRERRVAAEGERSSDLATEAGLRAIADAGIGRNDVDLIIVATATPDRKAPSTACIVQNKLGISNKSPAFDIAAVCSGFLYGMTVASHFVQSGTHRNVLLIGADTFSKITDWSRRDCVFFGDGAGAALLQRTDYERALFSSSLYADGSGQDNFTVYPGDHTFSMDAHAVYTLGTVVLPAAIAEVTAANGLSLSDVAAIIPHQPSMRLLRRTGEVLGLPFERIKTNMERYANTSSGTIPILLDEVNRNGQLAKDDLIAFAAVGSGWTWGAALYRWH